MPFIAILKNWLWGILTKVGQVKYMASEHVILHKGIHRLDTETPSGKMWGKWPLMFQGHRGLTDNEK